MRKMNPLKKFSIFLAVALLVSFTFGAVPVSADPVPVKITRTVSTTNTDIGQKFTVKYDITGDEITIPRANKEIAVIIDTSGSMAWKVTGPEDKNGDRIIDPVPSNEQRITIAKEAAKKIHIQL